MHHTDLAPTPAGGSSLVLETNQPPLDSICKRKSLQWMLLGFQTTQSRPRFSLNPDSANSEPVCQNCLFPKLPSFVRRWVCQEMLSRNWKGECSNQLCSRWGLLLSIETEMLKCGGCAFTSCFLLLWLLVQCSYTPSVAQSQNSLQITWLVIFSLLIATSSAYY